MKQIGVFLAVVEHILTRFEYEVLVFFKALVVLNLRPIFEIDIVRRIENPRFHFGKT